MDPHHLLSQRPGGAIPHHHHLPDPRRPVPLHVQLPEEGAALVQRGEPPAHPLVEQAHLGAPQLVAAPQAPERLVGRLQHLQERGDVVGPAGQEVRLELAVGPQRDGEEALQEPEELDVDGRVELDHAVRLARQQPALSLRAGVGVDNPGEFGLEGGASVGRESDGGEPSSHGAWSR